MNTQTVSCVLSLKPELNIPLVVLDLTVSMVTIHVPVGQCCMGTGLEMGDAYK